MRKLTPVFVALLLGLVACEDSSPTVVEIQVDSIQTNCVPGQPKPGYQDVPLICPDSTG